MVWYARNNQLKLARGNSGSRPTCIPTLASSSIGAIHMERIPLTQDQFAIVSGEDFTELSKHKWCAAKLTYGGFAAVRDVFGKTVYMHRVIMNATKGIQVDHKNHDTLDNRRANLRLATRFQNQHNAKRRSDSFSQYKGVSWHKRIKKWIVGIKLNNHRYHLGYFISEIEAALAYDKKAKELFGEFAHTNF